MTRSASLPIIMVLVAAFGISAEAQTISQLMASESMRQRDELNIPSFLEPEKDTGPHKSKFLALGLSMILPGAGQYYTEDKKKMAIFGSVEAAIWTGFFGLRSYGAWKKEDYKAWAAFHAGADVNGKSDLFYEKLTYYDNINEYNQLAPLYDGDQAVLFDPDGGYYWNWDTTANRDRFRNLRNQSKSAYRRSIFLLGGALINRILSGIDAYRSANAYGPDSEFGQRGWRIYYTSTGPLLESEVRVGLVRRF
jgi:hypothetical protein